MLIDSASNYNTMQIQVYAHLSLAFPNALPPRISFSDLFTFKRGRDGDGFISVSLPNVISSAFLSIHCTFKEKNTRGSCVSTLKNREPPINRSLEGTFSLLLIRQLQRLEEERILSDPTSANRSILFTNSVFIFYSLIKKTVRENITHSFMITIGKLTIQ